MANNATFAERLLAVRQERGLKRSEVAERMGSTGPVYGRYECGERVPSIETAKIFADVLVSHSTTSSATPQSQCEIET